MVFNNLLTDKICTFLPDDARLCRTELSDQACGFYTGIRICLLKSAYDMRAVSGVVQIRGKEKVLY